VASCSQEQSIHLFGESEQLAGDPFAKWTTVHLRWHTFLLSHYTSVLLPRWMERESS